MIVTLNDQAPLPDPPGTQLLYVGAGHNRLNVECRRLTAKPRDPSLFLSPKWLDGLDTTRPAPVLSPRPLRTVRSVVA